MKIRIYGKIFEFADEDVEIIDDEAVTPDDFADVVRLIADERRRTPKMGD